MQDLTEEDGRIRLPARMDQQAAAKLRDAVLHARGALVLDAGEVSQLSTSAVQVLLAARAHLTESGDGLRIEGPSAAFVSDLATTGVQAAALGIEGGAA